MDPQSLHSRLVHELSEAVASALQPGSQAAANAVKWMHEFQSAEVDIDLKIAVTLTVISEKKNGIREKADGDLSAQRKLFAFNSLDHLIQDFWYKLSTEFRENVKRQLELMISDPDLAVHFLSDGLSRCVVEVMHREWPQNWPQLIALLLSKDHISCSLSILWRLADDAGIQFKPKHSQRRREVLNAITENLNSILSYIWQCMQSDQSNVCLKALRTLAAYLQWVPIDAQLLRFLSHMLTSGCQPDNQLLTQSQIVSCDCLISVMTRKKVKADELAAMEVLSSPETLTIFFQMLSQCLRVGDDVCVSDDFIDLRKKMCLLVTSAGKHLLTDDKSVKRSDIIHVFIREMLPLFKHRNQTVCQASAEFFKDLLNVRANLDLDEELNAWLIRELFVGATEQLIKKEATEPFVVQQFDGYAEYEYFFVKMKEELANILRQVTGSHPNLVTDLVLQFVDQVNRSCTTSDGTSLSGWESAAFVLDCVCNKLPASPAYADRLLPLLTHLLCVQRRDPDLLSIQLSCVSALSTFLPQFPVLIAKQVIDRVLCLAKYSPESGSRDRRATDLRRHSCSCFVKMCRRFPHRLLPFFDGLQGEVASSSFSKMEMVSLIEGLLLISNAFEDSGRQKGLICRVLSHIEWLKGFAVEPEKFMNLMGISAVTDPVSEECVTRRTQTQQAVALLLALFRRLENKSLLMPEVESSLQAAAIIACNLNGIWEPSCRCLCNPSLAQKIYAPASDSDRAHLLEYSVASADASREEQAIDCRIHNWLWSLEETLFTVFGCAFSFLHPDVYKSSAGFLRTLSQCHFLPRMKLKLIVKHFLKAFVQNLSLDPQTLHSSIDPLLSSFLPWLYAHIDERWNVIRNQESQSPDDERLGEELLNDQANRLLSREFADLLNCLMMKSVKATVASGVAAEASGQMDVDSSFIPVSEKDSSLSDVGRHCVDKDLSSVAAMAVGALTWPDSVVNQRLALLNKLLMKEMLDQRLISTSEEVSFLVHHILLSLRLFEESEQNQTSMLQLALVVYEELAKNYSEDMRSPFWILSQSESSEWTKFHQTLIEPSIRGTTVVTDKKKRDALKSLLSVILTRDCHLSQKSAIKNLRPLAPTKRRVDQQDLIASQDSLSLVHLFS